VFDLDTATPPPADQVLARSSGINFCERQLPSTSTLCGVCVSFEIATARAFARSRVVPSRQCDSARNFHLSQFARPPPLRRARQIPRVEIKFSSYEKHAARNSTSFSSPSRFPVLRQSAIFVQLCGVITWRGEFARSSGSRVRSERMQRSRNKCRASSASNSRRHKESK